MAQAKKGDTVRVEYEGRLSDGSVFDSSEDHGPLEFTLGEGKIIRGFEEAVEGMNEGESLTTTIPAADAYGPVDDRLRIDVPRNETLFRLWTSGAQPALSKLLSGRI